MISVKIPHKDSKSVGLANVGTQTNFTLNIKCEDSETGSNSIEDHYQFSSLHVGTEEEVVPQKEQAEDSTNAEAEFYQCKDQACNRIFVKKETYEEHHKSVHCQQYDFKCTILIHANCVVNDLTKNKNWFVTSKVFSEHCSL